MFKDKLNKLLGKDDDGGINNKRKIENLVFFIVLLIVTVVAINLIWNGNKNETNEQTNNTSKQLATTNNQAQTNQIQGMNESDLETKLEEILSQIQGVGEVKVLLNYSESSEVVAMYNETSKTSNTEETDTSGGTRKIQETDTQKDIIYQEDNGEKTPITQKNSPAKNRRSNNNCKRSKPSKCKSKYNTSSRSCYRACNT